MSLISKYDEEREGLDKLCEDNNLELKFLPTEFPLTVSIYPVLVKAAQQSLIEDSAKIDQNARIDLIFADDLYVVVTGDITITDELLNKLKNKAKKLHYTYLQLWYKQKDERFAKYAHVFGDVDTNGWRLSTVKDGYRP